MTLTVVTSNFIHQGARPYQEDCFVLGRRANSNFFVVADGLGGHHDGADASLIACQVFDSCFTEDQEGNPNAPLWGYFQAADRVLMAAETERRPHNQMLYRGMSTTLLAAVWKDGEDTVRINAVGDSLMFHYHDEDARIELVNDPLDEGGSGALTYCCGQGVPSSREDRILTIKSGDMLILATDGVERYARMAIYNLIERKVPNSERAQALGQFVLDKNSQGQDNLCVVVLSFV